MLTTFMQNKKVIVVGGSRGIGAGVVSTGGAAATVAAVGTATTYTGAEMDDDSGEQIYIEFRAPINRASDQTEDVKLVVEF